MEIALSWWQALIALVGAVGGVVGGVEGLKWLVNRKANSRIAIAEAESAEFHHLQETNEWLQKQLQNKEERFAEQTLLVRKQNTEIIELTKKIGQLELELAQKKCEDMGCPFRLPPNAMTPPKPGLTKEQYHLPKLLPNNSKQ